MSGLRRALFLDPKNSIFSGIFGVFSRTPRHKLDFHPRPSVLTLPRSYASRSNSVTIKKIIRRCPGRRHYICLSDAGVIRKPAESIPGAILREFDDR